MRQCGGMRRIHAKRSRKLVMCCEHWVVVRCSVKMTLESLFRNELVQKSSSNHNGYSIRYRCPGMVSESAETQEDNADVLHSVMVSATI